MTYSLSSFLLITFSILNSLWFDFLQFFFVKRSNNFFTLKISNNICPRNSILKLANHRNFFRPIWNLTFCKKIFLCFNILTWSPSLNLGYFSLFSLSKSMYVLDLTSGGFISIVLWYLLFYLLTISANLLIYTFFNVEVICLQILFFKVLINLSETTDFPLHFYIIILQQWFHWYNVKLTLFFYPYFVRFAAWLIQNLLVSINNCDAFFVFQMNNPCIFTININNT